MNISLLRKINEVTEWRKDNHWGNIHGRMASITKYC